MPGFPVPASLYIHIIQSILGWQILDGKIVDGHIPPDKIMPYSTGKFSISGRDSSAVAPKGTIYIADSKTLATL